MRILVAPDAMGELAAPEVAEAIATGWQRQSPDDDVDLAPLSAGGLGFVSVLHAVLGGSVRTTSVRGPFGEPVAATILLDGSVAYVEAAQACGVALTGGVGGERATSYGVGELLLAAREAGAEKIVVGLGDVGSNDGGAGLLAALGATADCALDGGVSALDGLTSVELPEFAGAELVIAGDTDGQLAGLFGTTKTSGPSRGISEEAVPRWDAVLAAFGAATSRVIAATPGAGAGGGIGHALLALGASYRPGLDVVADAVDLRARAARADLVVTGMSEVDPVRLVGSIPAGIAPMAADAIRPCVVLGNSVALGNRELRAAGIEAAYAVDELPAAASGPFAGVADLAARVARSWSVRAN